MSAIKTFFKVLKAHLQIFGVELNTKISPEVRTKIEAITDSHYQGAFNMTAQ